MNEHFRENQKLFYGILRQLRHKKGYNTKSSKDKNGNLITQDEI